MINLSIGFRRRWWLVFMAVVLLISCQFLLISCNSDNFKKKEAQVPRWVTATLSDPKTFNFALNEEFPNIFLFTAEGLTTINPLTKKIEPALAESWQVSEDKKKITFTLRDNLKWSDGKPLTADDVVFTFGDIAFNKDIPSAWQDTVKIGKNGLFPDVKKIDNLRVEFTFPEPFSPFLFATTGAPDGIGILPKHALEKSVKTKNSSGSPLFLSTWGTGTDINEIIVNGAYKIESYAPGQRMIFRRNPYYWRKDAQGKQLPYVERIIWQFVESTDTQILQFRSGGLDTISVSPENFSLLKQEEERGKFKIYNGGPQFSKVYISFNLNKGKRQNGKPLVEPKKSKWFNDVNFRRAVAYGIDRERLLNNSFRGLGVFQDSPIDVPSPYYFPPEKGLKTYNYNPEKAKQLLLASGFSYNGKNQLLDRDKNPVRFTIMTNAENKTRVAMIAQIKQDLGQIGMTVDLQPIAFNTLVDKLDNSMDWDCYMLGFTGTLDPHDGANKWLPEGSSHYFNKQPERGQEKLTGHEVYDWERKIGDLYIQAAQELDDNKRKALYNQTQQLSQEYLPEIYLIAPYSLVAVRDRLQNIKFTALGSQGGTMWNKYELKLVD